MNKLVTIITPTWQRNDLLLSRCIQSVMNQTYSPIEHIVVCDGIDDKLRELIVSFPNSRFVELGRNWGTVSGGRSVGAIPRNAGMMLARGEYIGYLDDDDEFLPHHVEILVSAIEEKNVDFVFSQMRRVYNDTGEFKDIVGDGNIEYSHIGTPMILHKPELLLSGGWELGGGDEDFNTVKHWVDQGKTYAFIPNESVKVYVG